MAVSSSLVLAGGAAALGLYWYGRKRLEDAREPPSVGRYPLVGSMRHIHEPLYLWLYENFGSEPVVRVHFGTQCVYVFNKWSAFKEAMVDNADQLSGRLSQKLTARLFGDVGGIVASDGEVWRDYRRFTLKTLRDFGFGRRGAEEIITVEAEHLHQTLDEAAGKPVETSVLLSTATSNIICQLVFGSRLASEDEKFGEILEVFRKITHNEDSNSTNAMFMTIIPLIENLPFIADLFFKTPASKAAIDDFLKLLGYCNEQRDKHIAEMEGVDTARDYIEAHLLYQRDQPEMFNDTRLTMAVSDLFIAGTDTTANTLRWAILYMIDNPDVCEKVHEEVAKAIGNDRLPTMQDKARLPYTQAVIEEVHRKASLVPMGVFHRVVDEVTLANNGGWKLQPDSICTFNTYAIHHDPEVFPQPEKFLPERHLKEDGQFAASPHLSTFGLGKRACLGESLARMELLVFFVTLVQRYSFSLDPEDSRTMWQLTEDPSFSKGTVLRSPPLHKIVFKARNI
ncbi:hypothetical protein BOX15_Mlig013607g2 [Macrostomum lignano]|uniref:Cytochrome P450 n=1 Tax=Macrostomum lignano TaxID=282301 RepID=A0A267FLL8_9PLAT|nr:hypothetical protein BOX15_Mlig013607g2 [Macrostomum lignano]